VPEEDQDKDGKAQQDNNSIDDFLSAASLFRRQRDQLNGLPLMLNSYDVAIDAAYTSLTIGQKNPAPQRRSLAIVDELRIFGKKLGWQQLIDIKLGLGWLIGALIRGRFLFRFVASAQSLAMRAG
jgi:hypothetical protein